MKSVRSAVLVVLVAGACSPAPSPEAMARVLAENPEILFRAMEKEPSRFMDMLNQVATAARAEQAAEAERRREEEFQRPKAPVVATGRAVRGHAGAPVTIVEYSDFQCPYCRSKHEVLTRILSEYRSEVRLVLKHLPSERHPYALPAARMFEAIALQNAEQAWQFHDLLFADPERLEADGEAFILAAAGEVGADVARAVADAQDSRVDARLAEDRREAEEFGFAGTPALLINGVSFYGLYPQEELVRAIDRHLAGARR